MLIAVYKSFSIVYNTPIITDVEGLGMLAKRMEASVVLQDDLIADGNAGSFMLKYYSHAVGECGTTEVYGVGIEKYEMVDGEIASVEPVEAESTPGLTESYDAVKEFISTLVEGMVTPLTLNALADDWVAQQMGMSCLSACAFSGV